MREVISPDISPVDIFGLFDGDVLAVLGYLDLACSGQPADGGEDHPWVAALFFHGDDQIVNGGFTIFFQIG